LRSLAINLDLNGALALVIGCGRVGRRKLSRLLGTGARIVAVDPAPSDELVALRDEGALELHAAFEPGMLQGCRLVMAAAGAELPREVLRAAREGRVLLNSADSPELGSFTLPAVAEDGPLSVAVSTQGLFPALSAAVAARLRNDFSGWGAYVELLGRVRPLVLASGLPRDRRDGIFRRLAQDAELPGIVVSGKRPEALALLARLASPVEIPPDLDWPHRADRSSASASASSSSASSRSSQFSPSAPSADASPSSGAPCSVDGGPAASLPPEAV
jgi:siroheme synthase-like protein